MIIQELKEEIIRKFQIVSENNFEILQKMSGGFSGAEVYQIALKNDSHWKGNFFLKIDASADEFSLDQKEIKFPSMAKQLAKKKIGNYYVLLMEIAGKSNNDFTDFYGLESPQRREEMVTYVFENLLNAHDIKTSSAIENNVEFATLCKNLLGDKLNEDSVLSKYLHNSISNASKAYNIQFKDMVLPNPYLYGTDQNLLNNYKCTKFTVPQHGDFHGNNLFISQSRYSYDYSIIDFDSYRKDGLLFFDSSYFALSLLLKRLENTSLMKFVSTIQKITNEEWQDLDFKDKNVLKNIFEGEKKYIIDSYDTEFSYRDKLVETQLISKIIAGLNYAGKKKVSPEVRDRAFIFASVYLKKLFELTHFDGWKDVAVQQWQPKKVIASNSYNKINSLMDKYNYLSSNQRTILIIGENFTCSTYVAEGLPRVQWSGVISFCNNTADNELKKHIADTRLLKQITSNDIDDALDAITGNTIWWLNANGITSIPETLSDSFASWRIKNFSFLQKVILQINNSYAPEDITFIIDSESFNVCNEHLIRVLEQFDLCDNVAMSAAVLGDMSSVLIKENFLNISYLQYSFSLEELSLYFIDNFPSKRLSRSYLPHITDKLGVQLDSEDEKFIGQYVVLVNDALLEKEPKDSSDKKNDFYYGDTISWTAISEKSYIDREEFQKHLNTITNLLLVGKPNDQDVYRIPHLPGAGATVMCKKICWDLRKTYPVIEISNINDNLYECCKRINSISSKHIIIALDDGFSQNEVLMLLGKLKSLNIKCLIINMARQYRKITDENQNLAVQEELGILSVDDSRNFKIRYIEQLKNFSDLQAHLLKMREDGLEKLTSNLNYTRFRLPFFYGMYAFENDFKGINEYVDSIVEKIKTDSKFTTVINYAALITYFSEGDGLFVALAKKLITEKFKSLNELIRGINAEFSNLVYCEETTLKICHPIIAYELLKRQSLLEIAPLTQLCKNFIVDHKKISSSNITFDRLKKLLTNMFVTRNTELDVSDDAGVSKNNFSQIILDINNHASQEEVFKCLVDCYPEEASFYQHYGRLIISNNPSDIDNAAQQLTKAINLEPSNNTNYHTRGICYKRHIWDMLTKMGKEIDSNTIFNKIGQLVEMAIKDFQKSIELGESYGNESLLVYPYTSIIQISTYVVTCLIKHSGMQGNPSEFFNIHNSMTQWCESVLATAQSYNSDTEFRYSSIREDKAFSKATQFFNYISLNQSELKSKIISTPNNNDLKKIYLSNIQLRGEIWDNMPLMNIKEASGYCEDLIILNQARSGIVWKWFNLYTRLPDFEYTHLFSILESMPSIETNLLVNFLLYVSYFCKYLSNINDVNAAQKCLDYLDRTKTLGKHDNKFTMTQLYYSGNGQLPIASKNGDYLRFSCTVINEIKTPQSGHLSLDLNPKFKAFFVPAKTGLKVGQSFEKAVDAIIGFSYDGLRAWDIKEID
ncbi:hypothetical protein [Scatolibacter rhodanostii]|uniref:hypothetical protein n=1 Tax=Scatolibacter rhodanostii TaxID=2014781 RepID=UPI000C079802|nr:hypothetical protein [Scatolibacter rhodanostii]